MMGQPDFTIDLPNPGVRMRNVRFYVEPQNWLAKLLWHFIGRGSCRCTWIEEPIKEVK